MTESQREEIIEGTFPDWREHLNDGKVIDHIRKDSAAARLCSTGVPDQVVTMSPGPA